jgi:hypothetical protein
LTSASSLEPPRTLFRTIIGFITFTLTQTIPKALNTIEIVFSRPGPRYQS